MDRSERAPIHVGDWVRAPSPGVWRVTRILKGFYELRYSLEDRKRRSRRVIIFLKRLVGQDWTPAFKAEVCDIALVRPLSSRDFERLEKLVSSDPDILSDFENFLPSGSDFMFDLRLKLGEGISTEEARALAGQVFADLEPEGLTNGELLARLEQSALAACRGPGESNATLRFACRGHETREGEFVFRAVEVMPF